MDRGDHILVIEDDHDIRHALVELLCDDGYQTTTAINGAEALRQLRSAQPPRMILLDLIMPVMDGWTFRQLQLRDPEWREIPVVVMSAVADLDTASPLAADAYLTKPAPVDRVLGIVAALSDATACATCGKTAHRKPVAGVAFCDDCLAVSRDREDDPYRDSGGGD